MTILTRSLVTAAALLVHPTYSAPAITNLARGNILLKNAFGAENSISAPH